MKVQRLEPEFIEFIPKNLLEGRLYVSIAYDTTAHLCACGCGTKVVAPLSPTDWHLAYDGRTVSLWPSIGNWSFPCRSHYIIDKGDIRWAARWKQSKVEAKRAADRVARQHFYGDAPVTTEREPLVEREADSPRPGLARRILTRLTARGG